MIQHRHAQDTEWSDEMRLSLANPQMLNDGKEIAHFVISHLLVGQPYHVRVASYTEGVGDSAFAELLDACTDRGSKCVAPGKPEHVTA